MDIINSLTAAALAALCLDVILQLVRVWKIKSSEDVSILGAAIRFVAAVIILIKFAWIQDSVLVWGQLVLVSLLTLYIVILVRLRPIKPSR